MNNTLKASSLLMALLSPFLTMNTAQADSVEEWAYWQANPKFAPENFQFAYKSSPDPTTAEQRRTGTNKGELAEETVPVVTPPPGVTPPPVVTPPVVTPPPVETGWVGYSIIDKSSGYVAEYGQLGDVSLVPVNEVGKDNDRLLYADTGPASFLLDLSGTGDARQSLSFGTEGDGSFSVSVGEGVTPTAEAPTITMGEGSGTANDLLQTAISEKYFGKNGGAGQYIYGRFVIGDLMTPTNIAAAVAASVGDLSYDFIGFSAHRSLVSITVNFTQATWVGSFGPSFQTSGYDVTAGTISGNTLTSTILTGRAEVSEARTFSRSRAATVTGGKVTGRLVGALGLADIGTAGIIGKSELTTTSGAMNDIFKLGDGSDR